MEIPLQFITKYPKAFDENKKYPLVIYLHGAGSRGRDVSILETAAIMQYRDKCEAFPAIIIAPQCHADTWFDIFQDLLAFIEKQTQKDYIDENRIYLTGVSMGGYASWQVLMSKPELFAAAAILCGGGMYWNAGRLKNIPIYAYHGMLDEAVKVEESIKMVNAVNRSGGKASLTIFEDLEHNCWDRVYSDPKTYEVLFQHRKEGV